MKKVILSLLAATLFFPIVRPGLAADNDTVAKQRIMQNVPQLLVPATRVVRIDLSLKEGQNEKKRVSITNPQTIMRICSALRETITQERFKIGHQFHQPKEVMEIAFIQKDLTAIKLIDVGVSMFWMSWNSEKEKQQDLINFQSEQFEAAFFRALFFEFWQPTQ